MSEDSATVLERIREIARRARDAAPAAPAAPVPHWQQQAEERSQAAREAALEQPAPLARLQLEAGEIVARDTACARLRALLADGLAHSAFELVDVAGLRYGGRLHELRRGLDGKPPLDVTGEPRQHGARLVWFYRLASPPEQGSLL